MPIAISSRRSVFPDSRSSTIEKLNIRKMDLKVNLVWRFTILKSTNACCEMKRAVSSSWRMYGCLAFLSFDGDSKLENRAQFLSYRVRLTTIWKASTRKTGATHWSMVCDIRCWAVARLCPRDPGRQAYACACANGESTRATRTAHSAWKHDQHGSGESPEGGMMLHCFLLTEGVREMWLTRAWSPCWQGASMLL